MENRVFKFIERNSDELVVSIGAVICINLLTALFLCGITEWANFSILIYGAISAGIFLLSLLIVLFYMIWEG